MRRVLLKDCLVMLRARVFLCLDQTKGDTSVTLGRADAESFKAMLDDAQMRFPNARLVQSRRIPMCLRGKSRAI